jgi:hypothetical protein
MDKTLRTFQTIDGHRAAIIRSKRLRFALASVYWFKVYAKNSKDLIIYAEPHRNQELADKSASTWTLAEYITMLERQLTPAE